MIVLKDGEQRFGSLEPSSGLKREMDTKNGPKLQIYSITKKPWRNKCTRREMRPAQLLKTSNASEVRK